MWGSGGQWCVLGFWEGGKGTQIVWLELGRPVLVAQALQPSGQHVTDGALSVAGEGCKLVPGRQGYEAVVRSVCVHESCERRVVILHGLTGEMGGAGGREGIKLKLCTAPLVPSFAEIVARAWRNRFFVRCSTYAHRI